MAPKSTKAPKPTSKARIETTEAARNQRMKGGEGGDAEKKMIYYGMERGAPQSPSHRL